MKKYNWTGVGIFKGIRPPIILKPHTAAINGFKYFLLILEYEQKQINPYVWEFQLLHVFDKYYLSFSF